MNMIITECYPLTALISLERIKFLWNSFGSSDDIFSVDFISKLDLSVLQKYSLWDNKKRAAMNNQLLVKC